ncbi:ATP-binding protein [Leptolyngbya sp. 'hensonii']|nr:ATP-binding protein [Leptolyngbya sp. 'hensonii']
MQPGSLSTDTAKNLALDSTLQELTLCRFQIETDQVCREIAQVFDQDPLMPGVIVLESGNFFGMISRRRFLKHMSHPFGPDLFLRRPVRLLHEFISDTVLVLTGEESIIKAAEQALERPSKLLYEPIVVNLGSAGYGLLDMHQLLVAQSQIHQLTVQLLHEKTQAQLIQTEKMASLGQMVAGVAHEILNPINFIWGNIGYLSNYSQDLIELLSAYEEEQPTPSARVEEIKEAIELDFLLKDLPQVIDSVRLGSERLRKIVIGLKTFSHMDEVNRRVADLHECIDNTLLILNNRLKTGIEVVKHYGNLPPVSCYSGQLSQVFMNLLSNAIDALLEEWTARKEEQHDFPSEIDWQPQIVIRTTVLPAASDPSPEPKGWVVIHIADNGPGIPLEIQSRIFETFFTTKPVGKGTGLGLAISYQIVVEKHQGKLNFQSQPGSGTEFSIHLPL